MITFLRLAVAWLLVALGSAFQTFSGNILPVPFWLLDVANNSLTVYFDQFLLGTKFNRAAGHTSGILPARIQ